MDLLLYFLKVLLLLPLLFVLNSLLSTYFLGKKIKIPKIFKLFPLRFKYYKVSEQIITPDSPYAHNGEGIKYIFYALELFIITIPITIVKYKF